MSRATRGALLAAAVLAACSGGGGDERPPARVPPGQPQAIVLGAGNASASGGHRVVGGVLGGATEARSAQFQVRGGIQP